MSELEHIVRIDTIGEGARTIAIEADAASRKALAERFGLIAIDRLSARVDVRRSGDILHAAGRISAAVNQRCVATGGEVPAKIDEPFALRFVPQADVGEELELDEGELDDVGYEGQSIDLGEAVAQTLALALDPFPRAADADHNLRKVGVIPEDEARPFSALGGLRDLLKK